MMSPLFNIQHSWLSSPRLVIGIMTGTSMDNIDAVLVKFKTNDEANHIYKILANCSIEFPVTLKNEILYLIENPVHISNISKINFQISKLYSEVVKKLCFENNIASTQIDAIAIHGQTVWHQTPEPSTQLSTIENKQSSTLQLASISALAQLTGITTVGNFRAADIALGGNGAPLVPIFDYMFLTDNKENRIVLNIGGIANITYLPSGCSKNDVIAFDTGPGNILIDRAMNIFFDKQFDTNGEIARSGNMIVNLFNALKNSDYILKPPPKSTGRELFNDSYLENYLGKIDLYNINKEDIIHTLTVFTAWSITENIRLFTPKFDRIIVSGGGVKNTYLMELLTDVFPHLTISTTDDFGIPSQIKEALCFAYLAYRTLGGLPGNIPSATGATREAILGEVAFIQ